MKRIKVIIGAHRPGRLIFQIGKFRSADRACQFYGRIRERWNRLLNGRFGIQTLGTVVCSRLLVSLHSRPLIGLVLFACCLPFLLVLQLALKISDLLLLLHLRSVNRRSRFFQARRESLERNNFIAGGDKL